MRYANRPIYTMKGNIRLLYISLVASLVIFFITGFILYTPPAIEPPYASMTMRIARITGHVFTVTADKEQTAEAQESESCVSAAVQLPRLKERPKKIRMATGYKAALAQMSSILEDMDSVQMSDVAANSGEKPMLVEGNGPYYEEISTGFTLEEIIRQRMGTIEEVLEYASSQMGISVDLLAAVAWAESKMMPYALNVKGKAYYCTSKEQALRMLREIKTDNVDIGLLQVNYRLWGEPLGLQKEDLLDSKVCVITGAMILTYNLQRHRDPWVAIGRYHSGNKRRMKVYQTRVSQGLTIIRALSQTAPQKDPTELSGTSLKTRRVPAPHREEWVDA
jgi:hypothetical protein